jgi:octaprenyl-diphosphate synthase
LPFWLRASRWLSGNAHVTIAALIEFIHTATLLHDDVVDESDMRRGKATANAAFGNAATGGFYLYPRLSDDDQPGS